MSLQSYDSKLDEPVKAADLPADLPKQAKAEIIQQIVWIFGATLLFVLLLNGIGMFFGKTVSDSVNLMGNAALMFLGGVFVGSKIQGSNP